MSPRLEAFLAAEDLDQLLDAKQDLGSLNAEDTAAVRAILQRWRVPQAVSNLLFHPDLIPEEIRLDTLFRGLAESQVGYYILAAVVGFQGIDPNQISEEERNRVATALWEIIAQTADVRAQRASASIHFFATEPHAPAIFSLLSHSDKTVRHNLRAWLFDTFRDRGVEAFAAAARASGISEELRQQVVAEFAEFMTNPPEGFKSPLFRLWAYIPNLKEIAG
jgi:hypothetical protein